MELKKYPCHWLCAISQETALWCWLWDTANTIRRPCLEDKIKAAAPCCRGFNIHFMLYADPRIHAVVPSLARLAVLLYMLAGNLGGLADVFFLRQFIVFGAEHLKGADIAIESNLLQRIVIPLVIQAVSRFAGP